MELNLERIIIVKKGLTGEAKVEYNLFSINKIVIDTTTSVDPVFVIKFESTPIIVGKLVDDLKEHILEIFQEVLAEAGDGIYEIIPSLEYNISKL